MPTMNCVLLRHGRACGGAGEFDDADAVDGVIAVDEVATRLRARRRRAPKNALDNVGSTPSLGTINQNEACPR